ncbi:MAG: hypothetical protein J5855_00680 [Mailhella sp.]|nr:hypothetical protein [Mailhella sp.]
MEHPLLAIDASGPETVLLLALPGKNPDLWPTAMCHGAGYCETASRQLLDKYGVTVAEAVIICTPTALFPSDAAFDDKRRMQLWKKAVETGGGDPMRTLRPASGQACSACGSVLLADPLAAFAMTALADDRLRARCWEEGVTTLWADACRTLVLLLFRNVICASYENRADLDADSIVEDIRQIQLNWLPAERVLRSGGTGCFIHQYPPEAEGFRPIYLFGPQRMRFSGMGKMAGDRNTHASVLCRGLIDGYARSTRS